MIINIRALLDKVKSLRTSSDKLDFNMVFSNGTYSPSFTQDESNKIEIQPQDGDRFLVGLAIIADANYFLTNNGLMVNKNACRATDVLLFASWEDAVNFCNELSNFTKFPNINRVTICAAYQHRNKENSLLFKNISAPFIVS